MVVYHGIVLNVVYRLQKILIAFTAIILAVSMSDYS